MKTITINLYTFEELSEEAKQKAINSLADINTDFEWWDFIYEDAERVGIKITGFDLDKSSISAIFLLSPPEVAENIIKEHGNACESYKTAKAFLIELEALTGQYPNIADAPEDKIEELEDEFRDEILQDYRIMLQAELEYKTSTEAIIETINANEYTFEANGNIRNL